MPVYVFAQPDWSWAHGVAGGSEQRGFAIVTDDNGDNISTGFFKGSPSFDGNILSSSGNEDGYVTKYDANGNGIWAVKFGGSGAQKGCGIATDALGNIYVCGTIDDVTTFYGNTNIILTPSGGKDICVAKFNSAGSVLWAKVAGSNVDDEALALCTDGNTVYVTGYFSGTATFGTLPNLVSSGGHDVFVAAFSCNNGAEQWAKKGGSSGNDQGDGIAVDASGIYVGGFYSNTITFQNHSGSLAAIGGTDIFLVKYNLTGTSGLWQCRAGSNNNDEGNCLTLSGNNVYVGGFFDNTMTIYNGITIAATISVTNNHDGFIIQYDATTGNYNWVVSEGGQNDDHVYELSCDGAGNVYATGMWNGTLPFGPGPPVTSNNKDVFVSCRSSSGTYLYGEYGSGGSEEEGFGIDARSPNAVYITGYFRSSNTTFGLTPLLSANSEDVFISKILCGVTAANAGSDQTYCTNSCSLNANAPAAGIGAWSVIAGGGTILSPNNATTTVTGMLPGVNTYRWTITNGTCSSYDDVTIMYEVPPSTADAGNDLVLCATTATLNATPPNVGTGSWSLIAGSGVLVSPSSASTSVIGLGAGDNYFEWVTSNASCVVSRDTVKVTRYANPTVSSAGSDQTLCSSVTSFAGNLPIVGTGMWSMIGGNANIAVPSSPTSSVNSLSVGQNYFVWTISNGTCPSSSDTMMIQVDAPPTTASAGADQTICSSNANLNGNFASSGSGVWSLISGSGTISNATSSNTAVSGLSTGQNIFQWTISNGVCPSSTDQVTITVDEMPTSADAGADLTLCSSSQSLNGNVPLVGTGMWTTIVGSGTIVNPNLPTSSVTGLPIGINIFQWTISNGVCPSSSDLVTWIVDPQPTAANAGADHARCSLVDTITGNVPLVGTGVWNVIAGSASIANPNSVSTAISSLGVGPNQLTWTISNGVCPASVDTITITRDDFPSLANAGSDRNSCSPFDSLSGNIPLVGNGTWNVIGGGSTLSNSSSNTCEANNLSVGQNMFTWTIANGSCPAETDTVLIVYNQAPSAANAGSDLFACGESISLQAETPTVGNGIWTTVNGSVAIEDSLNPLAAVPSLTPGIWYYCWTTQNGFCISNPDTVRITVFALPDSAIAGADRVTYLRTVELSAVPLAIGQGTWTFVQGSGTFSNDNDPYATVTNLSPGLNILRWSASNGTCPENSDELRIQVLDLIVPEGYSPNGDGINDNFTVTGLDEFQNPSLEIFSRWGTVVYSSENYQNDWNGTSLNGDQLPDDVYFFVLKPDVDMALTGYVIIKRNAE